ncbi:MAG: PIN domain-containing protein [Planctomycetes bacterium]|nr:PIN domain-containing protein [Planctomycetota bacterium]
MIYLDTHVVVWLHSGRRDLFSECAAAHMEENDLGISPMVLLELEYLREIGRIRVDADTICEDLRRIVDLRVCDLESWRVVAEAIRQTWTRDPFDRLIVGQAAARRSVLVTRDETMRANYGLARW